MDISMQIKIWQIDTAKDEKGVAFEGTDMLRALQGSIEPRKRIYKKVFDGLVDCEDLEAVYRMFNLNKPEGYEGRSLSVSDVVEVEVEGVTKVFFCDNVGWRFTVWNDFGAEAAS